MSYEFFISRRYLMAKRKQLFVSIITVISVSGVALGVAALIITLSIMNGYQTDIRKKIVGMNSDIVVLDQRGGGLKETDDARKKIGEVKSVVASAPFVYGQAMLEKRGSVSGAVIKGILPEETVKVLDIGKNMTSGDLALLNDKTSAVPGIVLGCELAETMGVSIGNNISLFSPFERPTHLGLIPRLKRFRVVGIFDSGMYEYDNTMAYVSLSSAQKLFNLGDGVTGIEIRIRDMFEAEKISSLLQRSLGYPYWARSWMVTNRNLFSALKLEKILLTIILVLIILVAAFNIISTLIMMTLERTRDIGILKAMGAVKKSIMKIFVLHGLIIGLTGTCMGTLTGYVACRLLDKYKFIKLPADVYYLDTLPVRMQVNDFIFICCAAILISLVATIYPAYKASRLNPCEAIRYE